MDIPSAFSSRVEFLSRIVEQFRELADEIGGSYRAVPWSSDRGAGLTVSRQGEGEAHEVLSVRAHFDSGGTKTLGVSWERQIPGEPEPELATLVTLGWENSAPDADAGLDSMADAFESEHGYEMGRVLARLRADVLKALKSEPGFVARLPAPLLLRNPVRVAEASSDDGERAVRGHEGSAARHAAGQSPAPLPGPDVGLLQSALGELATAGGLKAKNVFAGFIKAAASPGALKQGDVAAYAQGTLLELSFFYAAFLRMGGLRASDLGMEGGRLRDAVVKAKAAFFEQDEAVRWQVAREMVTGMRLYYAGALAAGGVPDAQAKEILKSTFGREAAIASEAISIYREPERAAKGGRLARLLGWALD